MSVRNSAWFTVFVNVLCFHFYSGVLRYFLQIIKNTLEAIMCNRFILEQSLVFLLGMFCIHFRLVFVDDF